MKLWLLESRNDLPRDYDKNPWERLQDLCHKVIVRAEDERSARALAAAAENSWKYDPWFGDSQAPWLNPEFSDCTVLTADGPAEVITRDIEGS